MLLSFLFRVSVRQYILLCFVLLIASPSRAQVDRASLTGTVSDSEHHRIPSAVVTAVHLATGEQYKTLTSASGTYDLPELPLGAYRVTCGAKGFLDKIVDRVDETVGHTRTLDIELSVAGEVDHIEVTDTSGQFDRTNDTLGSRVEPQQVKELPLNGRNWSTLTALVPGAVDTGGSNQRSIRFAGRGLDDNNFSYDGIVATNIVNQAQQPFVRLAIPTEAIEEFRIDTMLFAAEDGSTPGGQIAVVSRTGTDELHGGLFEYLRNDVFDAHQPIDPAGTPKPAFRLN